MSVHTVDVEGYGPVTIRAISPKWQQRLSQYEDAGQYAVALLRRGLVEPAYDSEAARALYRSPDLTSQVVYAIGDLTEEQG